MLRLVRTQTDHADFLALVKLLDRYLAAIDGDEHAFYAKLNVLHQVNPAVVAYRDETPIGCGAFRETNSGDAEIKRMFVLPAHRQQGVAQAVLTDLEDWAAELGYPACVLETGKKQLEALALYHKSGYRLAENYGQYVGVANSVCMCKELNR